MTMCDNCTQQQVGNVSSTPPPEGHQPDLYPGYEDDLNHGVPVTLGAIVDALNVGGVAARSTGYTSGPGQIGMPLEDREVFATFRNADLKSYWVTGVRLLSDETGSRSLAGAIELILEDGDDAQVRYTEETNRAEAQRLVDRLSNDLAALAGYNKIDSEVRSRFAPIARGILRAHGPELDISVEVTESL